MLKPPKTSNYHVWLFKHISATVIPAHRSEQRRILFHRDRQIPKTLNQKSHNPKCNWPAAHSHLKLHSQPWSTQQALTIHNTEDRLQQQMEAPSYPSWRNWLARQTVNLEAVSSTLTGGVYDHGADIRCLSGYRHLPFFLFFCIHF